MKKTRILFTALSLTLTLLILSSCGAAMMTDPGGNFMPEYEGAMDGVHDEGKGELINNGVIAENPFVSTEKQPVSTFSADVDTASYAYLRKLLFRLRLPRPRGRKAFRL